jgi:predicted Ser/Thr protein kinase
VIENGIDLTRGSDLDGALAFTGMEPEPALGTCAICGRPLTQVGPKGECLRCLADLGFLSDSRETEKSDTGRRLMPGPLKYDHFEVEVGADGFPIELGSGAIATTYRARDTVLNSVVALKVIDRKVAQMPGVRSRFLREARAAAQIRHPNVARVSHYGEQDGECFYVMELVEGETLEAKVRRDGPMPLALALEVIEQAARALAAAEKCGVVHRDIKPSNIMLESDPSGASIVKVIDYGIAKILDPEAERGAEQTQTGFIGTPAFASPEQFAPSEQRKIDTRSDIYSLGATFWYLRFRSCAICWAHAPRSCGKTGRGTPARATEECSRAGACDRALAVDVGCRSSEAPSNSARTSVGHPRLLHKVQYGSTCTSEASCVRSGRGGVNCRRD